MLLPHGVLVAFVLAWRQGSWAAPVPALALGAFALAALLFMGVILWRRTSAGVALAAIGLMVVGAPILLLSMLFRELAESAPGR
jgi:ABC-type nitrate/sulfonate/bicarbonate transport system substrate-binding protein